MASKMNIPIARTSLFENEIQSVISPLETGWLVQGPRYKNLNQSGQNSLAPIIQLQSHHALQPSIYL